MELEKIIREMVAAYTAPLMADCERMRAEIDRAEKILLDKHDRDAERRDRDQIRIRLDCLLTEIHGVEDRVLRLADERFPQWRLYRHI
jgi:predicted secreted Zn-dependent protease